VSNVYDYGIHKGLSPPQLFFMVMLNETSEELGVKDLEALGAAIAGYPLLSTRAKFAGTTKGTSIASKLARTALPINLRTRVLPTLTFKSVRSLKFIFTRNIGTFVGRAIPVVGEVLLARDVSLISIHSVRKYNQLVKTEDQVF